MVTKTEAVNRINDAIGWRLSGHNKEAAIVRRLVEAQRKLEHGTTLPRWLLEQDFELTLLQGERSVALPAGFLRLHDENLPHYVNIDTNLGVYLEVMDYISAFRFVSSNQRPFEIEITTRAPSVFVVRKSTFDFISMANTDYTIVLDYYKAGDSLASSETNVWLDNGPDWLIGEAGVRIAADLRDVDAVQLFNEMRKEGRAMVFNEIVDLEVQGGPFVLGGQN